METLRMKDYSSPDEIYNIPLIESEINNRFYYCIAVKLPLIVL